MTDEEWQHLYENLETTEDNTMPHTVEALYHDGVVELKRKPAGIRTAGALVIFLDPEKAQERHAMDLERLRRRKSSVDKWIGVIEGAELGKGSI